MLSKARTIPGAVITVGQPKTGLPAAYGGSEQKQFIEIFTDVDRTGLNAPAVAAVKGDELTIVKPPRKIGRINLARVRTANGTEGEVYWCELRASSFHK